MVAGIIAAVAAVVGAVIQVSSAQDTNRKNDQRANRQTAFQASMANSAHQREMADLKAAGLNPILAANNGADSPSGATIQQQNPVSENFGAGLMASARDAYSTKKQAEKIGSDMAVNESIRELQRKQGEATVASAKASEAQAEKSKAEKDAIRAQMPAIKSGAALEDKQNKLNEKMVEADAVINRFGTAFNGLNSAKKLFKKGRTDTFYKDSTGEVTRELYRP